MKIAATTRTRNESVNIERFVKSYQWADKILIADGGSDDDTVEIAKSLSKTEVRDFHERIPSSDGKVWRNPHGKHINFIIDWATEEGADWIIFDDADCVPNYVLMSDARYKFKNSKADYIMVTRIYFYGDDKHFEKLSNVGGKGWTPSLWAWRVNKGIKAKEIDGWEHYIDIHHKGLVREDWMPPICLLHHFCPDKETMEKKLDFYRHMRPSIQGPLKFGGAQKPLEEWMRQ